mmetsp:Transcript_4364/g.6517  ORF Transcript_4364/g.6517 Transcript_4364/m.6517 type:complete len:249 (-) Transcript_4364:94-840(-)
MTSLLRLFTEDTSSGLGRLDYASFSQQTLMEMTFDGIINKEDLCGSKDFPSKLSEWKSNAKPLGNPFIVNPDGDIIVITMHYYNLRGSVSLEWLPSTVEHLDLSGNELTGTLTVDHLPPEMDFFNMTRNQLHGTLALDKFPDTITYLEVGFNQLTGTVDLTKLPRDLQVLSLGSNQLSGTLDLTKLPASLQRLWLAENDFHGQTDFSALPSTLDFLSVGKNPRLSGKIRPRDGVELDIKDTKIRLLRK